MTMLFTVPTADDPDIDRVERLLRVAFDEVRRGILRCNESIDVQACPGSGKTTLLVAKLAILASKWVDPRRGICVLSHTNVARLEIERKLGHTPEGRRLLSYPHFVGTIHRFVNEFVALPYLRTDGKVVRAIDDELAGHRCRTLLHRSPKYEKAKAFLRQRDQAVPDRTIESLRLEGPELLLGSAAGSLHCGPGSPSHAQLTQIKERACGDGFWRHDDMFALASRLLKLHPVLKDFLASRFPVLFIDEMQDTSETQSAILAAALPVSGCALRQRFGDSNQAIYDAGQAESITDLFPEANRMREIPNSLRFGPPIATLTDSLACLPLSPSLAGEGPRPLLGDGPTAHMKNTVFVFPIDRRHLVLPAFGDLLLESFSDAEVSTGFFRAIGHVGKLRQDDAHPPRTLSDYWSQYQPEVAKPEPRPVTLADHLHLAAHRRRQRETSREGVEVIARGLVGLAARADPTVARRQRGLHRWIESELAADPEALPAYRRLLWERAVLGDIITQPQWSGVVQEVRMLLRPLIGDRWTNEAEEFSTWSELLAAAPPTEPTSAAAPANVFRHARNGRSVDISVGTIHSAKGQTHTATLVLETYYHAHDLTDVLDWLAGPNRGWSKGDGKRRAERLRILFTAMTRPSHLLCLGIRRNAFEGQIAEDQHAKVLQARGWNISVVGP